MRKISSFHLLIFCTASIITTFSYSQEVTSDSTYLREHAVKVFLDSFYSYDAYIKTEIPYVNYVRDRKQAQVYIMKTTQSTASGGTEHTISLMGQMEFAGEDDTLTYVSTRTDTEDIIREGIVRKLKVGLFPYVAKTPLVDQISIRYMRKADPTDVVDKWNNWVFSVSLHSFFTGQKYMNDIMLSGSVSVRRITPDIKIRLSASAHYDENNYKFDDYTISSIRRSQNASGLIVKSLGEHWSVGMRTNASSSLYGNNKLLVELSPALEFNIFPYSESTRREFRLLYTLGGSYTRYHEVTIFDKLNETLVQEIVSATFEMKEKWGSVTMSLRGSHYFHDYSKNNFGVVVGLNLRLFEGLSLNLHANYSRIHDQLSLPMGGATQEEVLLHQKQLATQYSYFGSVGFSYTFGSIYSNVVNPRFGY